ncbi:MAG TPA: hypothetical protein VFQ61_16600 [Polyangiaceae bacterium]|nr:hypothetical protein [Polyangiaceae bacterium]
MTMLAKRIDSIASGLLANQFWSYGSTHQERLNLLLHALTVPLFLLGSAAVPIGLIVGRADVLPPLGMLAMFTALLAQARGHRREARAPASFRGPLDFVARIFAEQWLTFPRFVLSGGFHRAWRAARPGVHESSP